VLTNALDAGYFLKNLTSEGNAGQEGVMHQVAVALDAMQVHHLWLNTKQSQSDNAYNLLTALTGEEF
jgi:hypothetical protein